MVHVRHLQEAWIVIVAPGSDAKLFVVVAIYEVSE